MKTGGVKYLRILLTTRCNMSCRFCHREGALLADQDIAEPILLAAVGSMYALGFRKFKLMGGEPMLHPQLNSLVVETRKRIGASDLSMISNGTADPDRYEKLLTAGMDRLNISIHGWMPACFVLNTGCRLELCEKIKRTVIALSEKRLIGKLNYVVKKGVNEEDFYELIDFAGQRELVVDALNLLDYGGGAVTEAYRYSVPEIEHLVRAKYAVKESLEIRNVFSFPSRRLRLSNGAFVNLKMAKMSEEKVFDSCSSCCVRESCVEGIKAMRLTPSGILQPCLMRTDNVFNLGRHGCVDEVAEYLRTL